MKHYPLLDKGVDISGLEPVDFAFVVAIAFIAAVIGWIFIGIYTAFIFIIALIVSFVIIRAVKTNKYRGYFARRFAFRWMRRYHKIY
jgi:Flp pilus assembly protein TadB